MKDAIVVTTEATKGIGEKIADFWEISMSRVSEFLGRDNPYPKFRRLLRAIAAVTKGIDRRRRLLIIKADLDSLFAELLGESIPKEVETCTLCDELFDVIRSKMKKMSKAVRLKELREARVMITNEINALAGDKEH